MRQRKETIVLLLIFTIFAVNISGCSLSEKAMAEDAYEKVKIGVSLPNNTDNRYLMSKKIIDKAADLLNVQVLYEENTAVPEAVEEFCKSGCNGIILCDSSDDDTVKAIDRCDETNIYLTQSFHMLNEELSPYAYTRAVSSEYYMGAVYQDEYGAGYNLANALIENGSHVIGIISPSSEDVYYKERLKGISAAANESQILLTSSINLTGQGLEPVSVTDAIGELFDLNPDMDSVIIPDTALDESIETLTKREKKIKIGSFGTVGISRERFESGYVSAQTGGEYCNNLYAFMLIYNAIIGKYTKEEASLGMLVKFPYVVVKSPEDVDNFQKYFLDGFPYEDGEIEKLSGSSFADLQLYAKRFCFEEAVKKRVE